MRYLNPKSKFSMTTRVVCFEVLKCQVKVQLLLQALQDRIHEESVQNVDRLGAVSKCDTDLIHCEDSGPFLHNTELWTTD